MPCWYFERREIKNSPSFQDGIDPATENRYRREGARFIIDAGTKMGLRYDTCATGVVYFHRFYMFHSLKEFYRYVTAACCLFLAGKVEETPKKCKDIIKIAQSLLSSASFLRFGEDPREEVMTMERILLKTIKFDLQVEHPYSCMLRYAKWFKGDKEKTQKMAQMAWTFINDSLCTTLCLQWEPEIIAVSLMYLASRLTKFEPMEWSGRSSSKSKWWEDILEGMSMELMEDICHQVLDLYSSKQKKTDDSPPQSPAKGNKVQTTPPPPPDRTPGKRSREDTPSDVEPVKTVKQEREIKPSKSTAVPSTQSQSAAPTSTGAPIPVAQHITPSSSSHPGYTIDPTATSDYTSYNPYVSSQMYSASFMSQEGSQNIQSILAGSAPPPPTAPTYPDPHPHHPPAPVDTSQYPPIPGPPAPYGYPPPQGQYAPPPSTIPPPHPYPPPAAAAPPPYDPYAPPPVSIPSSFPPPSYAPPPVTQPPQHTYPTPSSLPPPPQTYGNYSYPPTSHSTPTHVPPPPQAYPPPQPLYSSQQPPPVGPPPPHQQGLPPPQQSQQPPPMGGHLGGYGSGRHRGSFSSSSSSSKHGKHGGGGSRKDIPALTEIKISGRPEWGPPPK